MAGARLIDATSLPVYDLGSDHPFARDRQLPLFDLLRRSGLVTPADYLASSPATRTELGLAHDADYVEAIAGLSGQREGRALLARAMQFGMGESDNPIAPGQHAAASAVVGATLACARAVMSGACEHAFNPAGGLHHALRRRASGFCIYNDLVVAIRAAQELGARRVLYVDFDVHHGDGVERAFAEDASVLTISFHESPLTRWPGTGAVEELGGGKGRGFAINAPLCAGTGDASWLEAVRDVLVREARAFRPDLIVSQHGCDPHREDPLADLQLTTAPMREAARLTHELAHELCGGRWVATGGGGYRPYHVIPRAWGMVWAEMAERRVPDRIDAGWREAWQRRTPGDPLPEAWLDEALPNAREREAERINRAMLVRLAELVARARAPARDGDRPS